MSDGGAPDGAEDAVAAADAQPVFREAPLPQQCPPADAVAPQDALFVRLVPAEIPTADDFRSCHLEGKPEPKKCDPCLWRACSFFLETTPAENLAGLSKLKNHADKKFKAFVRVSPGSGLVKINPNTNHVSFWMYETFLPETAVERIEPI